MFIKNIIKGIIRDAHNLKGWKTKRKIVVFESDDWGSIRMPSKEVYSHYLEKGYPVDKSDYNRLDALESNDDLELFFDVLSAFSDKNSKHPVITANTIVANPDFTRIEDSGFKQYFYEPISTTISNYPNSNRVLDLYKQGEINGVFHPQFHGREHLNINRWLKRLQNKDEDVHFSFNQKSTYSGKSDYSFMEAFDFDSENEIEQQIHTLKDGLNLFELLFGYRSKSFIAPCYVWDKRIESSLKEAGIIYLQGSRKQYVPTGENEVYNTINHYMGEKNDLGQRYLVRNGIFEPSLIPKSDWVDYTLQTIDSAFRWNKPVIITSHRINYMGSLDERNRDVNLKLLTQLLKRIMTKWPDVEFMTSDQLGDLMEEKEFRL
ncbi:MAG: hypothetical protein PHV20_10305 [Bacteroidales bacterium]|nr:hypothetical protein [Bacteroidales bacterium]